MSLQELEVLHCICSHSEEEHFYDGETAKTGCEAGDTPRTTPPEPEKIFLD